MRELGPGFLSGITVSRWIRLLAQNRFRVSPRYWPRALVLTGFASVNSLTARLERRRPGGAADDPEPPAPLFIIGLARSGTTLLHNLLCQDPRFIHLSLVESRFPLNFNTVGPLARRLVPLFYGSRRVDDGVRFGPDQPAEDEGALAAMTLCSHHLAIVFPRNRDRYAAYRYQEGFSGRDRAEWIAAFRLLLRRVRRGRRGTAVLKSPGHTTRIGLLLEAFPGARFVFIHRHPHDVLRSLAHTGRLVGPYCRLQATGGRAEPERVRRVGRSVRHYLRNRGAVPDGHLVELAFSDLEHDPAAALRRVYDALGLPPFADFEPRLRAYLESLEGYRKNRHPELSDSARGLLAREFPEWFETWGYSQ